MSKRILVVEDQEDLRAILRDFLSASGYTVIEAVAMKGDEEKARAAGCDQYVTMVGRSRPGCTVPTFASRRL